MHLKEDLLHEVGQVGRRPRHSLDEPGDGVPMEAEQLPKRTRIAALAAGDECGRFIHGLYCNGAWAGPPESLLGSPFGG